ncbi:MULTISPECIES: hypothetical protein [Acinetobacter]|uniref:Ribosomal protein L7/L12 C-terminal domain-containing protein n=1 Tax=Acinetobacter baylyi (strain ATCC 33305 / BD413 / ADP1) TaxID=62977 RepID=Q6F8A8_ACIAD|nr:MULTISPECIES: hypothetical protein [Acinetobacter]ENV53254.1 hypothetical protein F952_02700 [Acinetobacter baylyi DSM 14961 = CIP 107474]KAF2372109.1 hypothetical protein BSL88_04385 [Acinetobacter baylyi]KAF2372433.1 hypothetical protein BSL67_13195 [Acinetobacter baylyi]KAF2376975.1 hypothetical protein BSN81_11130 [Acinetobacter baylyi]KAF2379724.1 hypothetical protein BSN83_13415 [Acinetobacter baylyi]
MQLLTPKQRKDASKLIQHGQKIAAVKYIRDHTQCSLQHAKMLADQIEQQPEILPSMPSGTTPDIASISRLNDTQLDKLLKLIENGEKIKAIKYLVDHGGYSLQDAKQAVDMIEQDSDHIDLWLEADLTSPSSSLEYQRVRIDYGKRMMYVINANGQQEQIDEHHPQWDQIMQQFYSRTYPTLEACFIDLIKRRDEVQDSPALPLPISNNSSGHPNTFTPRPTMPSQMHGIEDQTQKRDFSKFILLFCIGLVMIAILFWMT